MVSIDDGRNRAAAQSLLYVIVTIQTFTLHGEEKLARLHGTRIDGIPLYQYFAVVLPGRRYEFGDARKRKLHVPLPADSAFAVFLQSYVKALRLSRATSTSSNGIVPDCVVCTFSWPFPASRTISPGAACCKARAIAWRRSGSMVYFAPDFCIPTTASFIIASGSSERGLSEVRTTRSIPLPAASPISGRLARSRLPPQPNIVMTLPLSPARTTKSRASAVRLRIASSVCA